MGSITVNRNELANALTFAQLGLSRRPVCPVLAGVMVTISAGTLELAAFDYEIAAKAKVSGHADGPAKVLVSGPELAAAVKTLPKGKNVTAELTAYDDGLIVVCDGIEATLSSLPMDEYPQLPALPEMSGMADGEMFARAVSRVALCASRDDTLPTLTGVMLTSDNGVLEFTATDRYRLAIDRLHWTGADGITALIPAVTLVAFARKADKHGKITLHIGEERAALSDGIRTLITRTIDGTFPKMRDKMRPAEDNTTTVLADAQTLRKAVVNAGTMAYRGEPISLDVTDGQITVTAQGEGKPPVNPEGQRRA